MLKRRILPGATEIIQKMHIFTISLYFWLYTIFRKESLPLWLIPICGGQFELQSILGGVSREPLIPTSDSPKQ